MSIYNVGSFVLLLAVAIAACGNDERPRSPGAANGGGGAAMPMGGADAATGGGGVEVEAGGVGAGGAGGALGTGGA